MHNGEAMELIWKVINRYRKEVRNSLFWKLYGIFHKFDPRLSFGCDVQEYSWINCPYELVLGNGLQHDIKSSEPSWYTNLYINMQREILDIEGMEVYLHRLGKAKKDNWLKQRMMSELSENV